MCVKEWEIVDSCPANNKIYLSTAIGVKLAKSLWRSETVGSTFKVFTSTVIGTLGVTVHMSGTVDETEGPNCDLKRLKAKPQTTKQHQHHALVVF